MGNLAWGRWVFPWAALLAAGCAGLGGARPEAPRPGHEIELVAAPARLELLDGRALEVWAYNGQVPGPTLRVRAGEPLRVRLVNRLPQPTTIHWHGVRVPNAMDGVPHVTQPPVRPGESFVYEFSPPDPGTYWFHPHLRGSEQVERGLHGVLIVEERDPVPFTRELLWVVDDWSMGGDGQLDPEFNTRSDLAHDGRWGGVVTVNGQVGPTVTLAPGERVRLRIVNVANGRVFAPEFGPLQPRVVAFDGLPTDRVLGAEGLELAPGNRVDLDLVVPASLRGQAVEVMDGFTSRTRLLATIAVAGEPVPTPEPRLEPQPAAVPVDLTEPTAVFRLASRTGGPFGIEWTINGRVQRHEDEGGHGLHDVVADLPLGRWARLRFVNDSFRLHPMHLHGVFFRVVARGGLPVDEEHWRDTVLMRRKETVDIAVQPRDLGLWMMHCHILEHAESGMMTLFRVSVEEGGLDWLR
ncbi:MAG: multicopper oxidase family protein [Deferrisomatales bacterium]